IDPDLLLYRLDTAALLLGLHDVHAPLVLLECLQHAPTRKRRTLLGKEVLCGRNGFCEGRFHRGRGHLCWRRHRPTIFPSDHPIAAVLPPQDALRSEEHTSELQSRFDLVCRLLLEKKKKNKQK